MFVEIAVLVLKIVAGVAVYAVVVLGIARFCATNTICVERERDEVRKPDC